MNEEIRRIIAVDAIKWLDTFKKVEIECPKDKQHFDVLQEKQIFICPVCGTELLVPKKLPSG